MEKRIENLAKEVEFLLNHAPVEDDCTKEENEFYSELANLKDCLANMGYY